MAIDLPKWQELLDLLHQLSAIKKKPFVAEYLKVEWNNGANTKYYASSQYSQISPFRDIKAYTGGDNIEARILGAPFRNFEINGDIRTENIEIELNDHDGEIKADFAAYGAARCELFLFYPQVDLNVSVWWGQLLKPQIIGRHKQRTIMTNGYRSKELFVPNELTPKECRFTFGGLLSSLAKIATNGCKYDRHLGGSNGELDPATGEPYRSCPKLSIADCIARLAESGRNWGGTDLNATPTVTDSPGNLAFSKGNPNSRNKPATWIVGTKYWRGSALLLAAKEYNQNHPAQGFIRTLWRVATGLVSSISNIKVIDRVVGFEHINIRLGARAQAPTSYPGTSANFSGMATVFARVGQLDPNTVALQSMTMECIVNGDAEIAVYSDPETFTRQWSDDRLWFLLEMYTNQKKGLKYEAGRFWIEDYLPVSEHLRKNVTFELTFPDREVHTFPHRRSTMDAALEGRMSVDQIIDVCRSGRISPPFQYGGKYSIAAFRAFTQEELDAAPVFSDHGLNKNIIFEGETAVLFTPIPDDKLTNEIPLSFEDKDNFDIARTITGDDPDQKLRASRLLGDDDNLQTDSKQYVGFGVRNLNEAIKLLYGLLWFGEFDEGGIKNNAPCKFRVPFEWVLGMKRYSPLAFDLTTVDVPIDPTGTAQKMTATAAGTASSSSNITVTVTAAGLAGTPVAVTVPIVSGDTPTVWAGKVRTALNGNGAIAAFFRISGTGTVIMLTARTPATNDDTWNTEIAAGTTGVTSDATSEATLEGAVGVPFQWFRLLDIKKIDKHVAEIRAIAYNRTAYEAFETESIDPPVTGMCSIDDDCGPNQVCVDGICRPVDVPPVCKLTGSGTYDTGAKMASITIDPC